MAAIASDFGKVVQIVDIQIIANTTQQYWQIELTGYIDTYQAGFQFVERIRNLSQ